MITIHNVEQGSEQWLTMRDGMYTGTSAHKLLKYGAIKYATTENNNFKGNFWTKRGHILEEEAIELYEKIKGCSVNRVGLVTNSLYPRCCYSPDGLIGLDGDVLIEVKCFDEKEHMKLVSGDIKLSVLAQIHFGLLITGRKVAHLIAYNPTLEPKLALKIITVKHNPAIAANFKRILA